MKLLKYILVALLIASLAALEFMHEFASDNPPGVTVQRAPDASRIPAAPRPSHHPHSH